MKKFLLCGVDVGSRELVVAIETGSERVWEGVFSNNSAGHRQLIRRLTRNKATARVCVEATGIYHLDLCLALEQTKGIEIMVANPRVTKDFARAQLRRSKTDRTDALSLLEFVRRMNFEAWVPPSSAIRALRALSRRIQALLVTRARVRCSLEFTMSASVGIDVAKSTLEWSVGSEGKIQHTRNEPRPIAQLVRRLVEIDPLRIVVESTGGYERALVAKLAEAGLPVVVVNPRRVRSFGEGMGFLAKTDSIDARLLALFGEKAQPPIRPILQGTDRLLADLVARRRQIVSMIVAEKNRRDLASRAVRRSIDPVLRTLSKLVRDLERQIDETLRRDGERAELLGLLQTVPGVGPGVARTLLIDLPEFGHLGRREIASLVGVAPFARDSGTFRGARRIRGGRASVRTALYLAAMTASRFNPTLTEFYQRLRQAGKPPKLAFIAVARKLLVALNAIARDRTAWQH